MADVQVAKCDGGQFDRNAGWVADPEPGDECPSTLELIDTGETPNNYNQKMHFQSEGWVRRQFRAGYTVDAVTKWWSFCPEHVMTAVEQYYLARFNDDSEQIVPNRLAVLMRMIDQAIIPRIPKSASGSPEEAQDVIAHRASAHAVLKMK